MIEERDDWFVTNVAGSGWSQNRHFGKVQQFGGGESFTQTGINVHLVEPGQAACLYHRENAQENFLVLAGECLLLVNGEERPLKTWDFVHCGPGVTHVFVGAGEGTCAILMIGHRPPERQLWYPVDALAARHGASAKEDTPDPRQAYADKGSLEDCDPPEWPISG